MNLFVVASDHKLQDIEFFVNQVASINIDDSKRSAVVGVDKYIDIQICKEIKIKNFEYLRISQFLLDNGVTTEDDFKINFNRFLNRFENNFPEWLIIEFDINVFKLGKDFIDRLASFLFLHVPDRKLNLIFIVQSIFLPRYLSVSNRAFNVLPENKLNHIGFNGNLNIFIFSFLEKIFEKIPIFSFIFYSLRGFFHFFSKLINYMR